jgi:hypothetical protein
MSRRPIVMNDGHLQELGDDELLGVPASVRIHIDNSTPAVDRPSQKQDTPCSAVTRKLAMSCGPLRGITRKQTLMSLRNPGTQPVQILKYGMGVLCTKAFGKSQQLDFGLMIARSFVSEDQGGHTATFTQTTNVLNTAHKGTAHGLDMRVCGTQAINPGRRSLEGLPVALQVTWAPAGACGVLLVTSDDNMLNFAPHEEPLTLAPNEGLVLLSGFTTPAETSLNVYVSLTYRELRGP